MTLSSNSEQDSLGRNSNSNVKPFTSIVCGRNREKSGLSHGRIRVRRAQPLLSPKSELNTVPGKPRKPLSNICSTIERYHKKSVIHHTACARAIGEIKTYL